MTKIYITGYSGRFPDCPDIPTLYNKLRNKEDCVSESKRYPKGYYDLPLRAGHLLDIDKFDSEFFKINCTSSKLIFSCEFSIISSTLTGPICKKTFEVSLLIYASLLNSSFILAIMSSFY